jgi:glycosyltransferase involved in cell wall biosynthesis
MNILMLHPSLNGCGGSEKVCLTIIESLKEKKYNVTLGTFERTNWKKVEKVFGNIMKPNIEITYPRLLGAFAYGELLNFHLLLSRAPKNYETVIVSCISPWFYCPEAEQTIIYMIPPVNYVCGLRRAYLIPYIFVQGKFLKKARNKIILTNSSFSSKVIENVYSLRSKVLYPPVDIEKFHPSFNKDDLVVSVGRFDSTKKHDILIRAFSKFSEGKCVIIGSIYGRASLRYFIKLRKLINDLGVNKRVELIANASSDVLRYILSKAKLYVHCMPFEHFGISIVEAMASGCVPVVHRSGGPYTDIIEFDKYGFSFKDVVELADKIKLLLEDENLCKRFSERALERSKVFGKENFKKGIAEIIMANTR